MKKGLFITMEGPDGAGKSTQLELLKKYFAEKGKIVNFTREPGGTKISEKIREVILDKNNKEMAYMTEALLYAASRAQLVEEFIKPALARNEVVICDRFVDSSIAYQGYGRKLGNAVAEINKYATNGVIPDLTILLKIDTKKGLDRVEKIGNGKDRMEQESLDFHERVLNGYLALEDIYPNRIVGVNADGSIEEVRKEILRYVEKVYRYKYEF